MIDEKKDERNNMTLAEVKRNLKEKRPFYIHNHRVGEFVGQIRVANIAQTNNCYLHVYGEPNNRISLANGGRGSWLEYGKAKDWKFIDNHCLLYNDDEHTAANLVFEISFLSDEEVRQLKLHKFNTFL